MYEKSQSFELTNGWKIEASEGQVLERYTPSESRPALPADYAHFHTQLGSMVFVNGTLMFGTKIDRGSFHVVVRCESDNVMIEGPSGYFFKTNPNQKFDFATGSLEIRERIIVIHGRREEPNIADQILLAIYDEYQSDLPNMEKITPASMNIPIAKFNAAIEKLHNSGFISVNMAPGGPDPWPAFVIMGSLKMMPAGIERALSII